MEITRLAEMRPRFVWDIVDDAFDLYRERFALLCGIAACVTVPISALTVFFTASGLSHIASSPNKSDPWANLGFLGPLLFISVPLYLLAHVLQMGATAVAVEAHLNERPIYLGDAYKQVVRRIWPLLGGLLMTGFFMLIGWCALFIGLIFAQIYLAFVVQAVMLENRGTWSALRRSKQLAEGNMLKVFGLLMLIGLLTLILSYGFQLLVVGAFELVPTHGTAQEVQKNILTQSATALVGVFLDPLSAIATTLLYYDLRVRREGLDIAAAAQETGVTLAPDPFGDLPSETVSRQMARAGGNQGMSR